ncbi:MAG: MBL fold metallo-hydrolase [Candidatus Eiseniibacteriota bacterium]|nr:MAG: MBL fold metallo-hydrolase [Candidatus Eisenbacteria bacterium]
MIFEQVKTGGDRNFAYLVADENAKVGLVVDPSFDCEELLERVRAHGLRIKYIVNTHSHVDHVAGNATVKGKTGAQVVMHSLAGAKHDVSVDDGDVLELGSLRATVLHTPGHTVDSICVLVDGKLVTGDTLFVGKVGGTDFGEEAKREHESLWGKLMNLPDDTEVWPGHDYGTRHRSTIGEEKRTNPFILRRDFKEFLELKKNWLEYKRIHGIK